MNDNEQLWQNFWADRSIENRNALVNAYVPMLWQIARKKRSGMPSSAQIEDGDLVGYGYFGLEDCIERFDPARGLKFATFAGQRINGAMVDGIRNEDWVPRLERVREKNGEVVPTQVGHLDVVIGETDAGKERFIDRADPHESLWAGRQSLNETVRYITRGLSKTERLILLLYYVEDLTMREIGQHLGLSESRISQMRSEIIGRLKRIFQQAG